jgi:hypothetical protein
LEQLTKEGLIDVGYSLGKPLLPAEYPVTGALEDKEAALVAKGA